MTGLKSDDEMVHVGSLASTADRGQERSRTLCGAVGVDGRVWWVLWSAPFCTKDGAVLWYEDPRCGMKTYVGAQGGIDSSRRPRSTAQAHCHSHSRPQRHIPSRRTPIPCFNPRPSYLGPQTESRVKAV
jgi:hypothetical protein